MIDLLLHWKSFVVEATYRYLHEVTWTKIKKSEMKDMLNFKECSNSYCNNAN